MLIFDPPKPSKVNRFFANIVFGVVLFFFAFVIFVIVAPAVVAQI
jgi:hypothetical protein